MAVSLRRFFARYRFLASENGLYELASTFCHVAPGNLVLIIDEQTKRGHWPKAIVQEVMPDSNDLVRRVRVGTAESRNLMRDIRKICLLEGSLEDGEH